MNRGKYDTDPYKILGVTRDATKKQIKKAYRKLALKYHPDKHALKSKAEKQKMEEVFKTVKEAYSIVSDPVEQKRWAISEVLKRCIPNPINRPIRPPTRRTLIRSHLYLKFLET